MAEENARRKQAALAGATHWATVDLIDLGTDGSDIRSALEQFGQRVNRFPIGQARHLVSALSEGHGSELAVWRYFD